MIAQGLLAPTIDLSALRGAQQDQTVQQEAQAMVRGEQTRNVSVPTFDEVLTDTVPVTLVPGAWIDDAFFWSTMQVRGTEWVAGEVPSRVRRTPRKGLLAVALVSVGMLAGVLAGAIGMVNWLVELVPLLMPS